MRKLGENKQTMILSGLVEGNNIKAMATPKPTAGRTRGPARNARFVRGRAGLREVVSRYAGQEPPSAKKGLPLFQVLADAA